MSEFDSIIKTFKRSEKKMDDPMIMKQLISIKVNTGYYKDFIKALVNLSKTSSSYVCVANVHMLVEALHDTNFAAVVNNADLITPDGMPLCFGLKLLYGINQERVCGMDLLPDLLEESEKKSLPVYFYGGSEEMLVKTREYTARSYPALVVAGAYSPPFRTISKDEKEKEIQMINASGAKFIFVILGCPKQEKWMAEMKGKIKGCMIGIGGALPVMIGMQKRAPIWMQKFYLEWLFRLVQEPKRLFKRYAITNSIFVWQLLKHWIKQGFKPLKERNTAVSR